MRLRARRQRDRNDCSGAVTRGYERERCAGQRRRAAARQCLAERASQLVPATNSDVLIGVISGCLLFVPGVELRGRVEVGLNDEGLEKNGNQRHQRERRVAAPICACAVASAEPVHAAVIL